MKANVFRGPNQIGIEEVPRPTGGVGEAVIRITVTTICGTDLHIGRGEYQSFRTASQLRFAQNASA